jgi:hypothetical protein
LSHSPAVWLYCARPSTLDEDTTHTAGKPAASGATAGIYLLAALALFVGIGLGVGWLAGKPAIGGAIGAAVGIPFSFYLVYRRFRDI